MSVADSFVAPRKSLDLDALNIRVRMHTAVLVAVLMLFATAVAVQWSGSGSIVVADVQAYLTGGVNLVRHHTFLNALGQPEVWFPPLFPLLIGFGSLARGLDPHTAGRLLAALSSGATLLVVWSIGRRLHATRTAASVAVIVLASNPLFQQTAAQSLSQPLATLLATIGLWIWLNRSHANTYTGPALLGLSIGLGYLTRPEVLLTLPLLLIADCIERRHSLLLLLKQYAIAGAVFAVVAAPYIGYLYVQTGRVTLSNKGEVNLAAGRASYYGMPREYIDPETLAIGFPQYPATVASEARRYADNIRRIGIGYRDILRLPLGAPVVALAVIGIAVLFKRRRLAALGIVAQFGYLPLMAWYAINDSYLHATLPAIALCVGVGVSQLLALKRPSGLLFRAAAVIGIGWTIVALAEQGTRQPRWAATEIPPASILKDAGVALLDAGVSSGTVIELGGTVSYYSRLTRGRLTPNELTTLVSYAHANYKAPVYLALSSLNRSSYRPTVASLLDAPGEYPTVLSMADARGRVVVLRLE